MDRQSLELLLAHGSSVESIGRRFGKHPSTVSYWMQKYGLVAPNREKHAAKGGIERERLEALVETGMTIAEVALEVERSKATARHWLRKYGLKTRNSGGRRSDPHAKAAKEAGELHLRAQCPRHGESTYILEGRGYYRCTRCRSDQLVKHRRTVKERLVAEAGGCCQVCGYDRCARALAFHHRDPLTKRLQIGARGLTHSIETLRAEAAKCVLLCANCHAEVESGIRILSLQ